ncbi:MAG: PilZ domain-containing protein [Acidobacteria bacterium]|nr:PilZ domain-containing protein [Acidobacteriota bacterium]
MAKRFPLEPPLRATFDTDTVDVLDLSYSGLRIRGCRAVRIGEKVPVRVDLENGSISVIAKVVWSHLVNERNAEGQPLFRSGLRVAEGMESMRAGVERLRSNGGLDPERDDARIDPDHVLMIRQAQLFLESKAVQGGFAGSEGSSGADDVQAIHRFLQEIVSEETIAYVLEHDRDL